ncbi:MAG: hypothetical protein M1828_004837 [Chrysothrix sp. TS-e1954]|nr:MAG: hypothetical protein M1828_004837 [Chrysothrix sp. TS-e1954]
MDALPGEVILNIFAVLEPKDVVAVQAVSRSFCILARDSSLWKLKCFQHSHSEALRRRRDQLASQESSLAELRRAMSNVADGNSQPHVVSSAQDHDRHIRAVTNWDPAWPGEKPDYYKEYIQRHGPVDVEWLKPLDHSNETSQQVHPEAIGAGVLRGKYSGIADQILAPLDDGSVCLWDVTTHELRRSPARLLDVGLYDGRPDSMNTRTADEISTVENVSVDHHGRKAYIAIRSQLLELDLNTFQVSRCQAFPFSISCLGDAAYKPIVVGTLMTLHLFDPRAPSRSFDNDNTRCELIAGAPRPSIYSSTINAHVNLSEPRPLSIAHVPDPDPDQFWVAGRFTSLLNYDRRCWPRVRGTIFSGARLSSLDLMPRSYVPRDLDLFRTSTLATGDIHTAKSLGGMTLVAAGEYRGKGSLELYGLPQNRGHDVPARLRTFYTNDNCYKNRQSAAKSRVLSVSPQGTRLVYSDGDGNIKWIERDGSTPVRQLNINDAGSARTDAGSHEAQHSSLFTSVEDSRERGDIVQRIVPLQDSESSQVSNKDELLIWTGEGRVGVVGFHHASKTKGIDDDCEDENSNAVQERQYVRGMRRALERQADDARMAQGFGLGFVEGM